MTTTTRALGAVAMAAILVLAGCAGPVENGTDGGVGAPGDAATPADGGDVGGSAGTVEFYVSDEENAIDDFESLEVTITKIGLHRAGGGDEGDEGDESDDERDSTETPEPTETVESTSTGSASTGTETTGTATDSPTATASVTSTATATPSPDGESSENADEENDGGKAGWVEYEVTETVDLTELKGPNATKLDSLAAPEGDYDKVFVYVDEINATLENGEQVNVKLPSEKLHIKKGFTVGNGENVSFVFDISVKQAGKSGKYILKPIVSESGTSDEVEIRDVDETDEEDDEESERDDEADENETDDQDDDAESVSDLTAEFQGPVKAGTEAKLKVTGADGPVANASVAVNGEAVGVTDTSGTITFSVPEDAEEVEVTVTKGDAETELERAVDGSGGNGNQALRALT